MDTRKDVKLLTTPFSGFGLRVEMALKTKGIPYETLYQDLQNKSDLLLSSNPIHKKIPVLIHNGFPVCESRLIIDYIEETWPDLPRLLPENPYDRYLVRFWADYIITKTSELRNFLIGSKISSKEDLQAAKKSMAEIFLKMSATLESGIEKLEKKGFIYTGSGYLQLVDVIFVSSTPLSLVSVSLLKFDLPPKDTYPKVSNWKKLLMENEVVKSTLPEPSSLLEYAKHLFAPILALDSAA